jgi:3-oxoacyl-[acyl-carrier-protein] synthase II
VLGLNNAGNAKSRSSSRSAHQHEPYVACASSAIAIGEAFRRLRSGEATIMVTGGSDVPQAYGVARAWEALRVMAPGDADTSPQACRPFAADRRGLVLGEGGAALVLEDWEHAVARGATIHGEIVGYGTSCDHRHLVKPEVAGQVRALRLTLADAGLTPADIDYVNAHGTARQKATGRNRGAEQVFANGPGNFRQRHQILHGHLLGGGRRDRGDRHRARPARTGRAPTAHLDGKLDPACAGVDHVTTGRRQPLRAALSNSFAFGGSNAVLAFRAVAP